MSICFLYDKQLAYRLMASKQNYSLQQSIERAEKNPLLYSGEEGYRLMVVVNTCVRGDRSKVFLDRL